MTTVLSRLNKRLVPREGSKCSLYRTLDFDPDKEPIEVLALAFIRHKYTALHEPGNVWGSTAGYLLYGILEYIVQTRQTSEERSTGVCEALWQHVDSQKGTEPYKSLIQSMESNGKFAEWDEAKRLRILIQNMVRNKNYPSGFRGPVDADTMITKVTVSIMKKGWISDDLVRKLNDDFFQDGMICQDTPMTANEIKLIYDTFGQQLISLNLHRGLSEVEDETSSMRIRLCRQRINNCSLTAYRTIKRAIESVSSFPWENVMNAFESQKRIYEELMQKLEVDEFYGFSEESGKYGSSLVGDLYYIARKLLVDHMGDKNLARYKCKAEPADLPLCEALFKEYKTQADALTSARAKELFLTKKTDDA